MREEKGSVVVSLLNISSTIENELIKCVSNKSRLFGTQLMKHDKVDDGEAYVFSSIELPEILKENLVAWVMFIHLSEKGKNEKYVMSLNVTNNKTGDAFSTMECEVSKDSWENVLKLSEFYNSKLEK